jgi:hypothetical protein
MTLACRDIKLLAHCLWVHHNVSTLKGRANNKWTEGGKLVLISCKPSEYVLSNIQLRTFLSDFLLVDSSFDEELMM